MKISQKVLGGGGTFLTRTVEHTIKIMHKNHATIYTALIPFAGVNVIWPEKARKFISPQNNMKEY